MKYLLVFILIFFCQFLLAQETHTATYISIDTYREMGKELSEEDYLNLKIYREDTLILAPADYKKTPVIKGEQFHYEYRNPEFLEIYKEIVFWKKEQTIRLWEDEIKIFMDATIPPKHQEAFMDFALGLSAAVDSLKVTSVDNKEDSNFIVYYTNSKNTYNYEPQLKGNKSSYYLHWNDRQRFEMGYIKVDTDMTGNPEYQIAGLKYHFFRSLGMFSDSKSLSCESYLSDCPVIRSLTPIDMELLKYHYSYGKPQGVDKRGFEKFTAQMQEIYDRDPNAKIFISSSK